ncbi:MAG TPA: hypothetical protein VML35_02815 [Gaiellaceae bacterium]|nr:hypothetical protein [Gaiellaceae bacterium]
MRYWLKCLGSAGARMDESAIQRVLGHVRFPRRPSVRVGDKLVLYAVGYDHVFAIVEVFRPVERGEGVAPYDRWICEVRPILWMGYAGAPRLSALTAGRPLRASVRQHSHIKLTSREYEQAVDALRTAGATADAFYRP